jgi:hypothetical protein
MEQWMQLRFIVRYWSSRGDDFDVKHRNTFCTFCRCHRDRARFDNKGEVPTGYFSFK